MSKICVNSIDDVAGNRNGCGAGVSVSSALRYFTKGERRSPVVVCIGSDRITGDALGPLTGFLLTSKYNVSAYVYGTLERPVTAKNLEEVMEFVKSRHPNDYVIAVDAALGSRTDVGVVKVGRGGLEPGSALNRKLPRVGDYCITAVVSTLDRADSVLLQDVRLHLVYQLAECIAEGVSHALGSVNGNASLHA